MKFFKNNQIIIYVIAFMLITVGYFNYTQNQKNTVETGTTANMVEENNKNIADIGDAALVSSNSVVTNSSSNSISNNVTTNEIQLNTTNTLETNNTNTNSTIATTNSVSNYFETSKLDRDKMYSQMLEVYEKVLNSSNSRRSTKEGSDR